MKIYSLIELLKNNDILSQNVIRNRLKISDSTLRKLKNEANKIGRYHGFSILTIRGEGYVLTIDDDEKFQSYLESENVSIIESIDQKERVDVLIFFLLQSEHYMTYEDLAKWIDVSRSTVIRDMKQVEKRLDPYRIKVQKQNGQGIRLQGDEKEIRRAFNRFVLSSDNYVKPAIGYFEFITHIDIERLSKQFQSILSQYCVMISDCSLKNIVQHLLILLYRTNQNNIVTSFESLCTDSMYLKISNDICHWMEKEYHIPICSKEIELLAAHISGKTKSDQLIHNHQIDLEYSIRNMLEDLDSDFLTSTHNDDLLVNALVLHIYPLLNRMYNNIQLNNPLVNEVYSEYANVFLLAIRFSDLIEKSYSFKLSKDEVGYIALHFAAHFEREKTKKKEHYKKILAICGTGGGSAQLIKIKLESIFPKASVETLPLRQVEEIEGNKYDLVLTTIPLQTKIDEVPVIQIKEWLDDEEIQRIEDIITQKGEITENYTTINQISNLFYKDLFYINGQKDYKEMLHFMANDAYQKGYASKHFSESVWERENRFLTIYKNGVAGPHPMQFDAKIDSISVAIWDKPFHCEKREIRIIFLMNFKKGHIAYHKEISSLLLQLIENASFLDKITKSKNFLQFINELERYCK